MTNEEAIKVLRKMYLKADLVDAYGDYEDAEPYSKAMDLAIEALNKQIPKPVETDTRPNRYGKDIEWHWCSVCGCLLDEGDEHCSGCGQKLLWEDENDY